MASILKNRPLLGCSLWLGGQASSTDRGRLFSEFIFGCASCCFGGDEYSSSHSAANVALDHMTHISWRRHPHRNGSVA